MLTDVRRWIAEAERLVVLTGAGISTDSGIPDFRGPNGVWTKNPEAEKASTLSHYVSDPEVRRRAWRARADSPMFAAEPNAGHRALAELDRQGRLHLLITQNIDGLHHAAGVDPSRIVEVHGNVRDWACLTCGARGPMADALERVRQGEDDPPCPACGGIIKSATISFGQSLVPDDIQRAEEGALEADLLLAVGSTLQVYPVAGVVPLAKRAGARLVIVNAEPTPFDGIADVVLHEPIGEVLPALVES
ncbi:MAG: NAD-dependent deacetylase [Acidimicrobiales bacterium]|nr:NAD-dependent deacetylase [Acidimicrobiales bacterium]